jgi:CRISPR-associated protein Cmr2
MKQEIGLDVDESKLEDVKNFLKKNSISPPVYYAILSMDGDEIGKWLNGKQMIPIKELMHAESKKALQHFWDKDKINDLHTIFK